MTNKELTKTREEMKLGKSEFAKLLGITPMLLGRYEKGSMSDIDLMNRVPLFHKWRNDVGEYESFSVKTE